MEKELNNLLSKPASYYKNLILKNNPKFDFKKPVILFGAGNLGREFLTFFNKKNTKIAAFSDNDRNKVGKLHCGIKVINKKEIPILFGKNIQIVASCAKYYEVIKDLKKEGFINFWGAMYFSTLYSKDFNVLVWKNNINLLLNNRNKIKFVCKLLKDNQSKETFINILKYRLLLDFELLKQSVDKSNQYFNTKIIKLTKKEIFLDGGAFDRDTIKVFIKKTNNHFSKVFAFEPDKVNFKKLSNYINQHSDIRIKLFNLGIGDKKSTLSFSNDGNIQSRIVSNNDLNTIDIIPIDKFKEPFTYIKLDIEGYEKQALMGAKKIIEEYGPKLAVCAYHYINDLWEVPLMIKKLNKHYKLYLRHHSQFLYDTVCYAT